MVEKRVIWMGSSQEDWRSMPDDLQDTFGHALGMVQKGLVPGNVVIKAFTQVHGSVMEMGDSHEGEAYRAMYTAKWSNAVYVLHCFQKKSKSGKSVPKKDVEIVEQRFRAAKAHSEAEIRMLEATERKPS